MAATCEATSPGEGQGATFVVRLPLSILESTTRTADRIHPTHPVDAEHTVLPSLAGVHALVVDDEPDARDLIDRILQEQGAAVTVASYG